MNAHCSKRRAGQLCDIPLMEESWRNIDSFEAGDTSSDQEYNTWSFLGRFGSYPGPATLAEPGRRNKNSRNNMPVVRRNQVVLTFLTNLAGMIFEHLEEKLVHCASLAV